jgi:H+-translocating NAD(P) transhydrogenase subunit alpha
VHIGIIKETVAGETRVAATPETVKKIMAIPGFTVLIERGAGTGASLTDEAYAAAGAQLLDSAPQVLSASEIVLKVRGPSVGELGQLKSGAHVIGMLNPFDSAGIGALKSAGIHGFSMEKAPRTTRAQSLDVLSSWPPITTPNFYPCS